MAQLLRLPVTLAKGLSPSTHITWLPTDCKSNSRGSNTLLWLLWTAGTQTWGTHIESVTHTHENQHLKNLVSLEKKLDEERVKGYHKKE